MAGRRNSGGKEERKKKKSLLLALYRSGQFCWSSCLWNGRGWLEGLVSLFSLPEPHSSLFFSLQSSSSGSFCSLLGLQFTSCAVLGLHQLGATHIPPSCSLLSQMLGALGTAMGQFSPLLGRFFPGYAVSPSPAAPLCWAFCLPPREPVGPSEFCAQGQVGVFQNWCFWVCSSAGSPAVDWVVWPISGLGLGWLPILSFGCVHGGQPATDLVAHPPRRFLSVRPGSQAAYQGACPPGVSGVGPRPLIGVRATWGTLGLAPRQPGCLSGRALIWSFSCGPPVR